MIERDKDELMQGKILHKLGRSRKFRGSHTAIENLYNYFPRHMRDLAKKNAATLIRKGFLIKKITGYGVHVSINQIEETVVEMNRLKNKFIKSRDKI